MRNPLDYIFGPQVDALCKNKEDLQLLKYCPKNIKIKTHPSDKQLLPEYEKHGKQSAKSRDDALLSLYVSHYLTRGEFALCVLTGVIPNDYV